MPSYFSLWKRGALRRTKAVMSFFGSKEASNGVGGEGVGKVAIKAWVFTCSMHSIT